MEPIYARFSGPPTLLDIELQLKSQTARSREAGQSAETSTQAMAVIPLVISVVFGLLISNVITLLALPALYAILVHLGWARARISAK